MKGRELLPLAHALAKGRPSSEPTGRTAVNRAYYAAYGEVSDYVDQRGYPGAQNSSPHRATWQYLRDGIEDADFRRRAERRAIADLGIRLRDRRQKADYRLNARLARGEPAISVGEAERIISVLDRLDAANPRSGS
jgi:hypothetical protein